MHHNHIIAKDNAILPHPASTYKNQGVSFHPVTDSLLLESTVSFQAADQASDYTLHVIYMQTWQSNEERIVMNDVLGNSNEELRLALQIAKVETLHAD